MTKINGKALSPIFSKSVSLYNILLRLNCTKGFLCRFVSISLSKIGFYLGKVLSKEWEILWGGNVDKGT